MFMLFQFIPFSKEGPIILENKLCWHSTLGTGLENSFNVTDDIVVEIVVEVKFVPNFCDYNHSYSTL